MKKLIQTLFALVMVAMTLSSCEDVPAPFDTAFHENTGGTTDTTVEPAGEGTLASPYNVAKSLDLIKTGTFTSDNVYIKGVITKIDNIDTSFGNAVYYLGDTGTDKSTLEVYRGKYFNGDKFTTGKEIAVGDTVVVYGTLTLFNSTPEVATGSQIVTINGKSSGSNPGGSNVEPAGEGTQASPYNVAKAQGIIAAGTYTDNDVYVVGTIVGTPQIDTGTYGNATYYISDDGTEAGKLMVYRGYSFNGDKFTAADQLKAGDKVVILGKIVNYQNNTPEVTMGSKIISLNGKTEGGSTPPVTPPASGITVDGTTVTAVNKDVTAGTTTFTIDLNTLGWANATDPTVVTLSDGSTITFEQNTNPTNSPKFYDATKGVRLYANNSIKFACKSTIAKIVFTCDAYNGTNYVGNDTQTISFDGANATYVNTYATSSGGVQLRVQTITITYAQ